MSREFSLAGLLRIRRIQQDQAASLTDSHDRSFASWPWHSAAMLIALPVKDKTRLGDVMVCLHDAEYDNRGLATTLPLRLRFRLVSLNKPEAQAKPLPPCAAFTARALWCGMNCLTILYTGLTAHGEPLPPWAAFTSRELGPAPRFSLAITILPRRVCGR